MITSATQTETERSANSRPAAIPTPAPSRFAMTRIADAASERRKPGWSTSTAETAAHTPPVLPAHLYAAKIRSVAATACAAYTRDSANVSRVTSRWA